MEFFASIALIILLALIGGYLATKLHQSLVIGYIFVGVLIGPYINIEIFGLHYVGIIKDITIIAELLFFGLIFLFFFMGLDFSIHSLRKTKKPATIIAFTDIGLNFLIGF
ncbi:MAG: cation:proton antiporter, partial [Candidatus Thermoplasmatota archaeon]